MNNNTLFNTRVFISEYSNTSACNLSLIRKAKITNNIFFISLLIRALYITNKNILVQNQAKKVTNKDVYNRNIFAVLDYFFIGLIFVHIWRQQKDAKSLLLQMSNKETNKW